MKKSNNIIYNKKDLSVSSFISYLIGAFDCKGINLGLKLSLVIFSRDYASSDIALESLVEHLDLMRRDKNNYKVVPVFYGVSRSAVKQQSGTFSDAFTKLESSYSADQVTKWRCALAETAELKGHEYDEESSEESEFVEEIAEAVFEILYPTEEIGIHRRQLEIEKLLCKQQWGLRTLGILGKPGIGKTILARAVFRRMVGGYDASCFINDFNKKYNEVLPDDFFGKTQMEEFDLNNSGSEQCYRQKRVLVVLDDVRNAQDAMSFLGQIDQFGPGSLIIITSRDRQVLKECHLNEIYELNGLNDGDAMKLLTRCAFGKDVIEKHLLDRLMTVIEGFEGNPSALRSYAEKLKDKTTEDMDKALFINASVCISMFSNSAEDNEHEEYRILQDTEQSKCIFLKTVVLQNFLLDPGPDLDIPEPVVVSERFPCVGHSSAQVQSLPQHFHRRQLVLLQRLASQFYKIWEGYKRFSSLRRINLGHCEKLVQVVELSNARYLEEIDLQECKSLESMPDTDHLDNLKYLDLSGCTGIKYFHENVRTIRELKLEGTGIREIRSETSMFSKLVKQRTCNTHNFDIYAETFGISRVLN